MIIEERPHRRAAKPLSPMWWKRYNVLKSEGFTHDEASKLAEGRIGTANMLRGRKLRREWYAKALEVGLTQEEIEARIDEMYDKYNWVEPHDVFYRGGEGELIEYEEV